MSNTMRAARPIFVIALRTTERVDAAHALRRLRMALKALKRYCLQCVEIREEPPPTTNEEQ